MLHVWNCRENCRENNRNLPTDHAEEAHNLYKSHRLAPKKSEYDLSISNSRMCVYVCTSVCVCVCVCMHVCFPRFPSQP